MHQNNNQRLISGLVDKGVEFFVHENEVKCVHEGRVYTFSNFPEWIKDIVEQDMLSHPAALKSLASWENLHKDDYLRQYIYCRFGGLDFDADINEDGQINHSEYFDCGLRGTCKYEGKLCCSIKAEHGNISKTEISILRWINLPNKNIADKMFISTETVNTHIQNLTHKTGVSGKVELAIYASKKGILEW